MRTLHTFVVAAALTAAAALPAVAAAGTPLARVPLPVQSDGVRTGYVAGPFLAGDAVVFSTLAGIDGTPARVWAADARGAVPPRVLPDGPSTLVGGGAAGVLARAAIVTAGGIEERNDPVYVARESLSAGPVDAAPQLLTTCIADAAVDGARVAFLAGEGCRTLVVRDVTAGREVARFPVRDRGPYTGVPAEAKLSGSFVAWREPDGVQVADLASGAVRTVPWPTLEVAWALGADGRVAFLETDATPAVLTTSQRIVEWLPGAAEARTVDTWRDDPANDTYAVLVGYSGTDLVYRKVARRGDRGVVRVLLQPGGGGPARTLITAPESTLVPGQALLGVDAEDGRIAWAVRDCDEAAVSAAAIADLPAAGLDLTTPEHCARPVFERTTMAVDRRTGRATVAFRCPAACSGRLYLDGVETLDGGGRFRYLAVPARPAFALARAGRLKVAVRLSRRQVAWLAGARGTGLQGVRRLRVSITGETGGRPTARTADVRVVAARR